jgi:hypothetical protein
MDTPTPSTSSPRLITPEQYKGIAKNLKDRVQMTAPAQPTGSFGRYNIAPDRTFIQGITWTSGSGQIIRLVISPQQLELRIGIYEGPFDLARYSAGVIKEWLIVQNSTTGVITTGSYLAQRGNLDDIDPMFFEHSTLAEFRDEDLTLPDMFASIIDCLREHLLRLGIT